MAPLRAGGHPLYMVHRNLPLPFSRSGVRFGNITEQRKKNILERRGPKAERNLVLDAASCETVGAGG